MDFSSAIKSFAFIMICLILFADESQGGPIKDNYIIVRPRDWGRWSQVLRASDSQIDPKYFTKRDIFDELSTTTKPSYEKYNGGQIELYTDKLNMKSYATLPPNEIDDEQVVMNKRQTGQNWYPFFSDAVPVYYYN